jgi:PAS domain-containing protein
MSDTFKRRRKRTGSTSARFRPPQLVPVEAAVPARIGKAELLACGAAAIVAIALIALIWIGTIRAVQEQRTEIRDRAEQALMGQAAAMAETIGHELVLVDQSLTILQTAWKGDSASVDLTKWQKQMPALTAVADDLFICDDKHIIRQDILPRAVGQGIGAAYVTFPHGSLEQFESDGTKDANDLLLQGNATGEPIDARQFLMYVVRPLDHPQGWLIGASYRSTELTKLFAQAALGYNPVVALVDRARGVLQAVVGPAARRPQADLSKTPLYEIMARSVSGSWTGPTAIDGVLRLNAFHQVPGRDMVVLVAASLAEVMAPADNLTAGEHALAFVATALVLSIGSLVLWGLFTLRGQRRRRRIFDRNRGELQRLRSVEADTVARAQLSAARLQVVLDSITDGVALFDSGMRLAHWNQPFLYGIGIDLRKDMPLDTLVREQAAKGLFGTFDDAEGEIARRTGILRAGDVEGLRQPGPDHETLALRGFPVMEGGCILILGGVANRGAALVTARSPEINEAGAPEVSAPAPIEW